jgi:hypothetical protein
MRRLGQLRSGSWSRMRRVRMLRFVCIFQALSVHESDRLQTTTSTTSETTAPSNDFPKTDEVEASLTDSS